MAKTALHASAGYNFVDDLYREIAEGLDVNEADAVGFTPLHYACVSKSYDAARILLEAGAEVNVQDQWGNAPLWHAVFGKDGTVALVQLLIDYGADPTMENDDGNSPLKLAQRLQKTDYLAVFQGLRR